MPVLLDSHWGVAPVRGVIHVTDRPVLRPGGPFDTACGLRKRLTPVEFAQLDDMICVVCADLTKDRA